MEWKRAKNILILLFIIIDLFLLFVTVRDSAGKKKIEYDELKVVLESNNIIISEKAAGKNKKSAFVYEYTFADLDDKTKKNLLGSYKEISKDVYSSVENDIILDVSDNNILYKNSSPDFSDFENVNEKNLENKLKKYLKMLGVSKYTELGCTKKDGDKFIANYIFKVADMELFSSELKFVVSTSGIHTIEGILCVPDTDEGYEFELSNIETILLNFSRNNNFIKDVEIYQLKLGCYLSDYENAVTAQALPVYMIETSEKTYLYDARDGVDSSQRQLLIK